MVQPDPNAFLGALPLFSTVLIIAVGFFSGIVVIGVGSQLAGISRKVPLGIFLWYFSIGILSYALLGPFSLSGDGQTYDQQAVDIAAQLGLNAPADFQSPLHQGKWGYPLVLGGIYALVGRMPIAGILLNCHIVGIVAILILSTAKKIGGSYDARWLVIVFGLSPTFVTLGPAVMREAFSWLGLLMVARALVNLYKGSGLVSACVLGMGGFLILGLMRTSLAALTLVAAACSIVGVWIWSRWGWRGLGMGAATATALVILAGNPLFLLAGYDGNSILATRQYLADIATTGFVVRMGPLAEFGAAGMLAASVPQVLLGPFPWEMGSQLVWLWVLINTAFWWLIGILLVIKKKSFDDHRIYLCLMILALVLLLGLATTLTNYGILTRLRALPMTIALIILSTRFATLKPDSEGQLP